LATGEAGIPGDGEANASHQKSASPPPRGRFTRFSLPAFPIPLVYFARQGQIYPEPDG